MFSQIEDFERCPACNSAYFIKEESFIIRKDKQRTAYSPAYTDKKIITFRCKDCNKAISEFVDESTGFYDNKS